MQRLVSLLVFLLLVGGCERVVEVETGYEAELAVKSTFYPNQTAWTAHVHRTVPLAERDVSADTAWITNATVRVLKGSGETVAQLHHQERGRYVGEGSAPQAGETYELRVDAPGLDPVRARSRVPEPISGLNGSFLDSTGTVTDWRGERATATYRLHFKDPAHQKDYYRLTMLQRPSLYFALQFTSPHPAFPRESLREIIRSDGVDRRRHAGVAFSDHTFAGSRFEARLRFLRAPVYDYRVRLDVLSSELFRYRKSKATQREEGENPFAEPPVLYSNIEGGAGIFAGFITQWTEGVVLKEITPRFLADRYEGSNLSYPYSAYEGRRSFNVLGKGGAFNLRLDPDGTASGELVVPANAHPDGKRVDHQLSGTYQVDKGLITFQFGEGTFISEKKWLLDTSRYPEYQVLRTRPQANSISASLERKR